jgi:hypothetical protein
VNLKLTKWKFAYLAVRYNLPIQTLFKNRVNMMIPMSANRLAILFEDQTLFGSELMVLINVIKKRLS